MFVYLHVYIPLMQRKLFLLAATTYLRNHKENLNTDLIEHQFVVAQNTKIAKKISS